MPSAALHPAKNAAGATQQDETDPQKAMQDSSDDELFVGLGDLSAAVDDDTAADVAEPSSTELDAFRTVELACLEGRRINTDAGAALATASGWYAKVSEGAYGSVIEDALLKAVV